MKKKELQDYLHTMKLKSEQQAYEKYLSKSTEIIKNVKKNYKEKFIPIDEKLKQIKIEVEAIIDPLGTAAMYSTRNWLSYMSSVNLLGDINTLINSLVRKIEIGENPLGAKLFFTPLEMETLVNEYKAYNQQMNQIATVAGTLQKICQQSLNGRKAYDHLKAAGLDMTDFKPSGVQLPAIINEVPNIEILNIK